MKAYIITVKKTLRLASQNDIDRYLSGKMLFAKGMILTNAL